MDGKMDVETQIRLIRGVIGRKYMEIDDYIDKSYEASSDDAAIYEGIIEFLKNDIKGYKNLSEDLKKGTNNFEGNYYDIASIPEKMVGLYNDYYLPSLKDGDLEDEQVAMTLKTKRATEMVDNQYIRVGRAALDNPLVIALMSQNTDILALLGKVVLSEPELVNALNDQ